MSDFPIYHGITLAANSYVENMVVEKLASDPVPVEAGRSWYNTTEKQYKFSTLDAGGAVVVKTFATKEQLDAEVAAINTTIGSLSALTTSDKTDIVTAINEVKTQVNNLGNAFNYVSTLEGGATEATANDMSALAASGKNIGDYYKVSGAGWFKASAAGTAFYANLNDGLVWNAAGGIDKIDNTDSSVAGTADYITVTGSTDSGYTVDVATAFKDRMSTAESDIDQLQTDIGSVASLSTVAKTVVPAINELSDQVNGKIGNVADLTTTAKGTIVAAINEVNAEADALQVELDTTQTGAGLNSDGTYSANLSSNYLTAATSLKDADTKLDVEIKAVRDNYSARRFTFQSSSAATAHTVTHNLNSQFVDYTVWVQRADGSWRNDVAGVRATSANVLDLYLTVASNVYVTATSMAAI